MFEETFLTQQLAEQLLRESIAQLPPQYRHLIANRMVLATATLWRETKAESDYFFVFADTLPVIQFAAWLGSVDDYIHEVLAQLLLLLFIW